MAIDSILTIPPAIHKVNYENRTQCQTVPYSQGYSNDLSFRFPFITGPLDIGRFPDNTADLNFRNDKHVSFKEDIKWSNHQLLGSNNYSISPDTYMYEIIEQDGTQTTNFFSNISHITPVTTQSTVGIDQMKVDHSSNEGEESNEKEAKPKRLTDEYISNLDELVTSVINGLLELQNEDKIKGLEEIPQVLRVKLSSIWDKIRTIQSSLHGASAYVGKCSNAPLVDQTRSQSLHHFKSYRDLLEKLNNQKEIDFSIWVTLNTDFKESTDYVQVAKISPNRSSTISKENEATAPRNDNVNQSNSPQQASSSTVKTFTQYDNPNLTIRETYEVFLIGVHSETNPFVNFQDSKYRPNDELSQTYKSYGRKYFSTRQSYAMVDYIKYSLKPSRLIEYGNMHQESTSKENKMNIFVKFLLWYKEMRSRPSSNHYDTRGVSSPPDRNLFLCAFKNGKLDIFSAPKSSKMFFTRGDIVIVQGDKGKDMAVVVEPILRKNLALLFQFLKRKIQIDSSSPIDQIHSNSTFINDFMDTINDSSNNVLIDTSRYGLIDMTRNNYFTKKIIRFATKIEVTNDLHLKYQDELKILHVIKTKIDSYNNSPQRRSAERLQIKILNAEFQFDMSKVYIYYAGDYNTDFSGITSDLFRFYKTRVWFNPIPNNLNVEERYFRSTSNELSMLQNMIQVNKLPYIHYNNNMPSYDKKDISRTSDFSKEELTSIPMSQKWKNVNDLQDMALDNYQISMYQELVSQLFD